MTAREVMRMIAEARRERVHEQRVADVVEVRRG